MPTSLLAVRHGGRRRKRGMAQTTRIFVAQPMACAVSFGLVNCAFFRAKSASTTPRAAAHFPQTKIGILSSMTLANASLNGGQPTGVTLSETGARIENSRVAR